MPFDPTWPPFNAELEAAPFRDQFNALKSLIDGLTAQVSALAAAQVPIGGIVPWFKDTPGAPALPPNYVECNGQILSDAASPLDGQFMPDINTGVQRFVRGGLSSGTLGGIDSFGTAQADNAGVNPPTTFVTPDFSPGAQPFPPYVTAVYVVRVK
jgi:hypothetical protein